MGFMFNYSIYSRCLMLTQMISWLTKTNATSHPHICRFSSANTHPPLQEIPKVLFRGSWTWLKFLRRWSIFKKVPPYSTLGKVSKKEPLFPSSWWSGSHSCLSGEVCCIGSQVTDKIGLLTLVTKVVFETNVAFVMRNPFWILEIQRTTVLGVLSDGGTNAWTWLM